MMSDAGFPEKPILIVDDEPEVLRGLSHALETGGIDNILCCNDSRRVMPLLEQRDFEVILLDLAMPHRTGEDLLPLIVQDYPSIPVIIITGSMEVDTAVVCMQQGAFDYMVKPVEPKRLISGVKRCMELNELQRENQILKRQLLSGDLQYPEAFVSIVTRNAAMISIFKYIEVIARSQEPVLLTGETGVGKELVARAIHRVSGRRGSFVPVNVAGLDDNMFSDTLFGHARGAFTDAHRERAGLIEKAGSGTLFLDEIGELNMASQVKLLRLLQEKEYLPLGSDSARLTDAHIVAATNRDLEDLLGEQQFRKDLFYRLEVHHVHVPPLRKRADDIPLLLNHFLKEAARCLEKKTPTPPDELYTLLSGYHFPGNIRELRSMVYDAVTAHRGGVLSMKCFRNAMKKHHSDWQSSSRTGSEDQSVPYPFQSPLPSLKEAERLLIRAALKQTGGNQSMAADLLGISRQTLNRKLRTET